MALDSSVDGWILRYDHTNARFHLVEPVSGSSPPTVVAGYTTYSVASNQSSRVINAPTHVSGDYIFVAYASDGDSDTASIPGFTAIHGPVGIDSNSGVYYVFYKLAGGSEPSTYTLTNTVSERGVMVAWAVRGMSSLHLTGTPASGTDGIPSFAAMTTTVANTLRFNIASGRADVLPYGTMTGYTKMAEIGVTSGGQLGIFYKTVTAAGVDPSATVTQTTTTTNRWSSAAFVVAP